MEVNNVDVNKMAVLVYILISHKFNRSHYIVLIYVH
jgi:hypothetical protein